MAVYQACVTSLDESAGLSDPKREVVIWKTGVPFVSNGSREAERHVRLASLSAVKALPKGRVAVYHLLAYAAQAR